MYTKIKKKFFACTVTKLMKLRFLTFKLNKSSFSMIKKSSLYKQ